MAEMRMPSLGADMEAGTLVEWRIAPGEAVTRGDVVAVVDTQKGAIDVEVFQAGVVERLLVAPGTKVPVGTPIAVVRGEGEAAAPAERRRVSPAARRRAGELGIHLDALAGSGPGGAITLADVEGAAGAREAPAPAEPTPAQRQAEMRDAIGAAMARSKREIPHYYLAATVDMSRTLAWLEAENARRPVETRILPVVPALKAVALAARRVPELNGFWTEGRFRPGEGVHVGVAVALRGGGLVAPALNDADRKDLGTLMAELRALVQRARAGGLRSSEMGTATLTVTNLGDQAVDTIYGVINPPQVAMVGLGRIAERPWAEAGRIEARRTLVLTLSADHRASDGRRGAMFLEAVDRLLQEPERL